MNARVLKLLEFPKIIEVLSQHAQSSLGKEVAENLKPSSEYIEVNQRLMATEEASQVERLTDGVSFRGVVDGRHFLKRASLGGALSSIEIYGIGTSLKTGAKVKRFLMQTHEKHPIPLLSQASSHLVELKELATRILFCIEETGEVTDQASPELGQVRREIRRGESAIREKLEQMLRSSQTNQMLQDQLITIRNDRYVLPVKQEYRANFGGIVHDQSGSGATLFIEPEKVVNLNNRLRESRLQEQREIDKILHQLSEQIAENAEYLNTNYEILAQLDFQFAKAKFAKAMQATLPIMNDRGYLSIKQGRHPLLDQKKAVPISLELGEHYHTLIITGPNTGGKTVTLKTMGLFSIMAMSGLFIPAEDGSECAIFDHIYADIGDEQSIEQNLSTFSSHMTHIIDMINQITPKSLVLLDELGAGTDPSEGSALAIAILDYIHQHECRVLATTHYSELKSYAYHHERVLNASMEFDIATLSPTYRLLVGIPGKSNAFAISERLGLRKDIILRAKDSMSDQQIKVEQMITSLEENRIYYEKEREEVKQSRQKIERLEKELEEKLEKVHAQKQKKLEKAEEQAREIVRKATREAEEVIKELRSLRSQHVKDHQLVDIKKRLEVAIPEEKVVTAQPSKEKLKVGDDVTVLSLKQTGTILELNTQEAIVQIGMIKMKTPLNNLVFKKSAKKAKLRVTAPRVEMQRQADSELDLRGENIEDALLRIDTFLDQAFLANLNQVYLIHGKGTGALRQGIQEFLRRHKHIKSYRIGQYNEGGTGVTVVLLK